MADFLRLAAAAQQQAAAAEERVLAAQGQAQVAQGQAQAAREAAEAAQRLPLTASVAVQAKAGTKKATLKKRQPAAGVKPSASAPPPAEAQPSPAASPEPALPGFMPLQPLYQALEQSSLAAALSPLSSPGQAGPKPSSKAPAAWQGAGGQVPHQGARRPASLKRWASSSGGNATVPSSLQAQLDSVRAAVSTADWAEGSAAGQLISRAILAYSATSRDAMMEVVTTCLPNSQPPHRRKAAKGSPGSRTPDAKRHQSLRTPPGKEEAAAAPADSTARAVAAAIENIGRAEDLRAASPQAQPAVPEQQPPSSPLQHADATIDGAAGDAAPNDTGNAQARSAHEAASDVESLLSQQQAAMRSEMEAKTTAAKILLRQQQQRIQELEAAVPDKPAAEQQLRRELEGYKKEMGDLKGQISNLEAALEAKTVAAKIMLKRQQEVSV